MNRSNLIAMALALSMGRVLTASPGERLTQPTPDRRNDNPASKRADLLADLRQAPKPKSASLKRMLARKARQ